MRIQVGKTIVGAVGGLLLLLVGGTFWALHVRGAAAPRQPTPMPHRADEEEGPDTLLEPMAGSIEGVRDADPHLEPEGDPARIAVPAPVRPASAYSEKERWFVDRLDDFVDPADLSRLLGGEELRLSDADWDTLIDLATTLDEKVKEAWKDRAMLAHQVMDERLALGEGQLVTEENRAELLRPAYPGERVLQRTSEKGLIVIRVPPGVDRRLDEPRRLVEELTELKKRSVTEFLESRLKKGR